MSLSVILLVNSVSFWDTTGGHCHFLPYYWRSVSLCELLLVDSVIFWNIIDGQGNFLRYYWWTVSLAEILLVVSVTLWKIAGFSMSILDILWVESVLFLNMTFSQYPFLIYCWWSVLTYSLRYYWGNGTNTNTNCIRGQFYSNIQILEYSSSSLHCPSVKSQKVTLSTSYIS